MQSLKEQGHEILVLARHKDVLIKLLEQEGVKYIIFGKHHKTLYTKIIGTFGLMPNYIKIARNFNPDVIVSKASWYGTATAKLLHKKSVIFPDSEVVKVTNKFVVPLCTRVVTPQPFKLNYGTKHVRIPGIFEDCYLAPQVFTPNPAIVDQFHLKQPYAILRFVGWEANHDVGNAGFNLQQKEELVHTIAKHMTVYISSEKELPKHLEATDGCAVSGYVGAGVLHQPLLYTTFSVQPTSMLVTLKPWPPKLLCLAHPPYAPTPLSVQTTCRTLSCYKTNMGCFTTSPTLLKLSKRHRNLLLPLKKKNGLKNVNNTTNK